MVMNDNGTVTFDLDGTSISLRRPTLGEYRDVLREPLDEIMDVATDALQEIEVLQQAAKDESKEEQQARVPEARRLRRDIGRKLDDMRSDWFRLVLKTLGPVDLDTDQIEMPMWVTDPDLAPELISHWRTRPGPRSGGQ
jgi:hypothetical protein